MNLLNEVPINASMPGHITAFSALDKNIRKFPWPYYRWLQSDASRRIYKLPDETNFYLVHKYEDVKHVLTDQETFSSQIFPDVEIPFFPMMKGKEHKRIRTVVQSLFSNKALSKIGGDIDNYSGVYTESLINQSSCDIVDVWSSKIPLATIASIFGYSEINNNILSNLRKQAVSLNIEAFPVGGTGLKPNARSSQSLLNYFQYIKLAPILIKLISSVGWKNFIQFNQYLKTGKPSDDVPRQQADITGAIERSQDILTFLHTIGSLLRQNNRLDCDTVIAKFLQAHCDGQVSFIEVLMGCLIILLAGYGTTSSLLSCGAYRLANDKQLLPFLNDNKKNIENFIEELLRVYAPLQRTVRRVTRPVEVADYELPKDTQLIILLGAANVDPDQFDTPYQFDPRRENLAAKHIAFGKGIHTCLGTMLARQIAKSAFTELLKRVKDMEIINPYEAQYITDRDTGMYGYEKLFLRVTAA